MYMQYSYNINLSILLVSLLSRASGSLRTTPFHFFRNVLTPYFLLLMMNGCDLSLGRGEGVNYIGLSL